MPIPSPRHQPGNPTRRKSPNLQAAEAAANAVRDVPRGNFMFAHHPEDWQVSEDGTLVPTVVQLSKEPGVQGVTRAGGFKPAQIDYEGRGWILIPHDVIPGDYVAVWSNRKGKDVHRSAFLQPVNTANRTTWAFDAEGWSEFVAYLREKGIIPPPRPAIVQQLLDVKRSAYDNLHAPTSDAPNAHDRYKRKLAMLKRQIGTLEDELAAAEAHHGKALARTVEGKSLAEQLRDLRAELRPAASTESGDVEDEQLKPKKRKK